MNHLLALSALLALACQSPSRPPSVEPMHMPSAPSSSVPPPVATPVAPPSSAPPAPVPAVPAAPGNLSSTLRFPRIAQKPPVLTLIVYNRTAEPFHYQEHRSAPCQLASLISFTMRSAAGKTLPMAKCLPSPGVDRTVAAGANVELTIPLAELYPGLTPGSYDIDASWLPQKPGASSLGRLGLEGGFSQPGHPLTIRPVMRSFVINRGETVQLAGGATLTFAGHSHKHVEAGSESPLIIEGTFTPAGGKADRFYISVWPDAQRPDSRVFAVGDHYFELGEYEYGASMHLAYFGVVR